MYDAYFKILSRRTFIETVKIEDIRRTLGELEVGIQEHSQPSTPNARFSDGQIVGILWPIQSITGTTPSITSGAAPGITIQKDEAQFSYTAAASKKRLIKERGSKRNAKTTSTVTPRPIALAPVSSARVSTIPLVTFREVRRAAKHCAAQRPGYMPMALAAPVLKKG